MPISLVMITIFFSDCNQFSQSFYDSVIDSLQLHRLTCSCGHSACLSVHGYYERLVKQDNGPVRLRVCRVRCAECGVTHALLPSSIVPYSQIPLDDQRTICISLEEHTDINAVCELNSSIDENNVKSVVRNYRRRWQAMLRSLRISLKSYEDLISSCFAHYSAQFMQIHRRANSLFSLTT